MKFQPDPTTIRVRLHVYDSVYDSAYVSMSYLRLTVSWENSLKLKLLATLCRRSYTESYKSACVDVLLDRNGHII
jgi:hypothetical protein